MGNQYSRPEDRLRHITKEVNSLRTSVRLSKQNFSKNRKEHVVETLAQRSNEVSGLTGKVKRKDIEETQKIISDTMQEVLKIEATELDGAAVESNSFVNVPLGERRSQSLGSLRSTKKGAGAGNRSSIATLRDIEAKIDELQTQFGTAVANKDSKQLRVIKQTIRVLAAELELIRAEKDTPFEKRKEGVDKKIVSLYQKVSRNLNELKKDDGSKAKSKPQSKQKALNELNDIELHLAENESLLDSMIKQKNSDFSRIRNNIVESNQRLAKVDIVDNEIKEKVVLLSQKLTEGVKNLDQIMAKREFDSKFQKSVQNYERIVRNFDPNTNATDSIANLQTIRHSMENLEEINDTSRLRKNELLQNINAHLQQFSEAAPNDVDQKIIEEIVEDNVILRKKVKSTDKEHTVIDQFINYWTNVKSNFNVNSYSNLSLLRIDSVLEEMQESINDIRVAIAKKCDTNPPTNLIRKRSQSVPKLNTKSTYGSNRSLDQMDSKIIKTRARLYDIPTPEVSNAQRLQENFVNKRFSKIEEVKLQVYYIKEKMDESHNKGLLRDKLEQYRQKLADYVNDSNKTVANNATLVYNEIIELLHKTVLAEFKEKIEVYSKRVHKFSGSKFDKEFDEVKEELLKSQVDLESFNIPDQFNALIEEKGLLLDEIQNSLEALQGKSSYVKKFEGGNVTDIKEKLQTLNDKVKRFSGTYKGVLYNQIERDLNRMLIEISEQVEDKGSSTELIKETERLLKILENRSSIAQSFRGSKLPEVQSEEQAGMTKIKRDLINIKKEIDRTPDNNVEAFVGLQSRLDLVNFELSQIQARSNENLAKEKEICNNEAETLLNVVHAKVALGQQPVVRFSPVEVQETTTYPKNDVNKEIEEFEKSFEEIKQKIADADYEEAAKNFFGWAVDLKKLWQNLQNYNFIRGTDLYVRQSNLVRDMQSYADILVKEAADINFVYNLQKKLSTLETQVNEGGDNQATLKELQSVKKELTDYKFYSNNDLLQDKKKDADKKIDSLIAKAQSLSQTTSSLKKIEEGEEKLRVLTPQITSFLGVKSDKKYYDLHELAMKTMLDMEQLVTTDAGLQLRRTKLLKELNGLGKVLDERVYQTQEIINLEHDLDQVAVMQQNFSGKEEDITAIKKRMETIKNHLHGLKVVNDLIIRKNACIERFSVLFNKTMTLSLSILAPDIQTTYSSSQSSSSSGYVSQTYNFMKSKSEEIDQNLKQILKDVDQVEAAINDTVDSDLLQELDDRLTEYTLKMSKLKYGRDSGDYKLQGELTMRIQNLADCIEEKLQDNDRLSAINNEVDEIASRMDTSLTYEEIDRLDMRLNDLLVKLRNIEKKNPGLKGQIDMCVMKIILCSKKISDFKSSVQSSAV